MENFTVADDNADEFQELLGSIFLSPVVPGKRGGGRKATNNIGADDLGIAMLNTLRTQHHVNLFIDGNLKGNTLWGVIDQKSYDRAKQVSMNIIPSYSQTGILAVSLARTNEGVIFVQWWKATLVNSVLSFQKILRKGAEYQLCANKKGQMGIWKMDATTGLPEEKNNGEYFSFPYSTLVDFEVYLNALVVEGEFPVSFPNEEVSKLQGLTEILAHVNLNTEIPSTSDVEDVLEDEIEEVE
jgi:hypothetical protein